MRHSLADPNAFAEVVRWTVRCWACLILSKCYSPDVPLWLGALSQNPQFLAYLTLPDHQDSRNLREISWTIWLLYCNQLRLHLSHHKCFWLLLRHYNPVQTHKVKVLELYYVACSFVWLSNPRRVKQWTMCQHTTYHDTTNHSKYLPRLALLSKHDMHDTKSNIPKYCKTFDSPKNYLVLHLTLTKRLV